MPIKAIIYTSTMLKTISLDNMKHMSENFLIFNKKYNISGTLLFYKGTVLQYIEGETEALDRLYTNILKDPRHYNIITLFNEELGSKIFKDWGLQFHRVDMTNFIENAVPNKDIRILFRSFLMSHNLL